MKHYIQQNGDENLGVKGSMRFRGMRWSWNPLGMTFYREKVQLNIRMVLHPFHTIKGVFGSQTGMGLESGLNPKCYRVELDS